MIAGLEEITGGEIRIREAAMNGGYVQQPGTPKEIYDTPANVFVATFMGSPSMNLIPVKVGVDGNAVYADTGNDTGEKISLAFFEPGANLKSCNGQTITLGIRPEALTDADVVLGRAAAFTVNKEIAVPFDPKTENRIG